MLTVHTLEAALIVVVVCIFGWLIWELLSAPWMKDDNDLCTMGPWKTLPLEVPNDGEDVWVRLNYWFGPPFLARWDQTAQTFTDRLGPANLIYPVWTISRWASQ